MNETTPEHVEAFAGYIKKWQRLLNLDDWRIHKGRGHARGAMADMQIDAGARLATWRLGKHFGTEPVTEQTLEATAVHELLHVLLADLESAFEGKAAPEIVEAAGHRVINTLERLLVPMTSQIATTSND